MTVSAISLEIFDFFFTDMFFGKYMYCTFHMTNVKIAYRNMIGCLGNIKGTFLKNTKKYGSIEGQGHFLTLAQGCVHTKIQTGFSHKQSSVPI